MSAFVIGPNLGNSSLSVLWTNPTAPMLKKSVKQLNKFVWPNMVHKCGDQA